MRVGLAAALNDCQELCSTTSLQSCCFLTSVPHTMKKDQEHPQHSSTGTVDLWEHACLLYHSYEWQSAADAFSDLEEHTSDPGDNCIFALNKGLIEARLGDFGLALTSFTKALGYDEANPVSHFLLGLLHVETRNYAKAKIRFETCLYCLTTSERDHRTHLGSFDLGALTVQENIDHMQSRLIATAAGHGRTSHLRTRLHIVPADVLFEPPSRSARTSQRDSRFSMGQVLDFKGYEPSDEHIQDPVSPATQPLYAVGHDAKSLHLVEDIEKNLTIEPASNTVNGSRRNKRLAPRDPRVRDDDTQELARFLRHARPSGDADVTVDRKYMQRLLQGNPHDRTPSHSHSQLSTPLVHQKDEFESLLGLYTGAPSVTRVSVSSTINSSVSDTMTIRQAVSPEVATTEEDEKPVVDRERPSGSRRPTLDTAQRWLRKEVRPPWAHDLADSGRDTVSAKAARDRSRGAMSDDKQDGRSLPSVVSSTEMFAIGRPRKE
jgi:hypothetical protein